mgnify:CR=1 FL=1|jgi:two-component system, NarL family, invasion response regulator UvrY
MSNTGILIVDDHEILRQGLRLLIDTEPSLTVVGEAESGEDALDAYLSIFPDVVLMDVNMPGMGGIETTRQLLRRDDSARIVGLSMHMDSATSKAMREAGCLGFVSKSAPFKDLVLAIRAANAGMPFPDDDYIGAVTSNAGPRGDIGLTVREQEFLSLIGRGMSSDDVAARLAISAATVNSNRRQIMSKLRHHAG